MIPGLIREFPSGYTYSINQEILPDLYTYPVQELSWKLKFKLLFRRKQKLNEVLRVQDNEGVRIQYTRYSTYKMYKGVRYFLSSYISCYACVKFEEDNDGGDLENNTN